MIVQTTVLKPTKLISWIASAIMLLYTYIIFSEDDLTQKNLIVWMLGLLLVAGSFLINRSSIILDNEGFTVVNWRKKKFIAYRDVLFADLVTHYHGHGYGVMWHIQTSDGKEHTIIPLGKRNMKKMAEALVTKLPAQVLGARVIKLAEGKRVSFF